jgi:predicted nucleic acid-binding protein
MKVVIDSNVIIADFWLESANFQILFESVSQGNITLYIPQVVIDEVTNKYRQRLEKSSAIVNAELRTVGKLSRAVVKSPVNKGSIEEFVTSYSIKLMEILNQHGVQFLDYPNISHQYIAQKAMQRKKPFNANEKGYRDNLIWENIKSLLPDFDTTVAFPDIVFISNNHKDFAGDKSEVHPELASELEEEGFNSYSLILYPTISEFNEKQAMLFFKQSERLKKELADIQSLGEVLHQNILSYLFDNYIGMGLYDFESDEIPEDTGDPTASQILDEDFELNILSVSKINATDYVVEVSFEVETEVDFFLDKHDYWSYDDEDSLSVIDHEWNRHVMLVSKNILVPITMLVVVDTLMNFKSFQFKKVNSQYF